MTKTAFVHSVLTSSIPASHLKWKPTTQQRLCGPQISFIRFLFQVRFQFDVRYQWPFRFSLSLFCNPVSFFLFRTFGSFILHSLYCQFSLILSRSEFIRYESKENQLVDEIWKCGPETRVNVSVNEKERTTNAKWLRTHLHIWVCVCEHAIHKCESDYVLQHSIH